MNKKNKKRNLIIFYIVFFMVLFLVAFFLSQFIFLNLEQSEIEAAFFMPHRIIASIIKNINHLTIFFSLCLLIIFGGALILNANNGSNFESEMDFITDTIQTPKAVGQSQHGSARWLKEKEYGSVFSSYTLAPNKNETIKRLVHFGHGDRKAVKKGTYEINELENTGESADPSQTENGIDEEVPQNQQSDDKTS